MREQMDMKGRLTLMARDQFGELVIKRCHDNRIVRTGRSLVARLFAGGGAGAPPVAVSHLAVGVGSDEATDANLALVAERLRKPIEQVMYEEIVGEGGVTRVRARLSTVFDFHEANGADSPLREAGLFTAAENSVMYNRVVFEPVTKTDAFQLTLVWDVVF